MSIRALNLSSQRIEVPVNMAFDYESSGTSECCQHFILLHGYSETGIRIFKKIEPFLPADSLVLAPNGLFAIPQKIEGGYKVGFSWYFYDPSSDEYFIDMKPAIQFLSEGLTRLGIGKRPTTIIGFSQGGYLAPFLAEKLSCVTRVIGLSSNYLHEEIVSPPHFQIDAIHGELDEIVDAGQAQISHEILMKAGWSGRFHLLPKVGHRITPEVQKTLQILVGSKDAKNT